MAKLNPDARHYFAGPNEIPEDKTPSISDDGTVHNWLFDIDLNYNHLEILQSCLQERIRGIFDLVQKDTMRGVPWHDPGSGRSGVFADPIALGCIRTLRFLIDATRTNALADNDNDDPEVMQLLRADQDYADNVHDA